MSTNERQTGQATVITVLFMTVLIAMAAAVLDIGSWYRADRALQSTVDAAALAGAQALPENPVQAELLALEYAEKNGGNVDITEISITSTTFGPDTITVDAKAATPGFFARLFGIDSVTVAARAKARAGGISQAKYVAPIVVHEKHPKLVCGVVCFNSDNEFELTYQHLKTGKGGDDDDDGGGSGGGDDGPDGSGTFGFINLTGEGGVGSSELGDWILNGLNQYMPLGNYNTSTGNPFSSNNIKGALEKRLGDNPTLLFPIYKTLQGTGDNAEYVIVGWVAFHITGMNLAGNNEKIRGWFEEVIWDGILTESGSGSLLTGVKAVELVE
jgi:Putative Flp pilus-assembly TadE/G-like